MSEFKDLIAQLYLASKPANMPFERFYEHVQVAIHHATKLPKRCARDLDMPLDDRGAFIFKEQP